MKTAIALQNVCLTLDKTRVLSNITFTLSQGEVALLLGENGAGKSMLLKTIAGWHRNYEGRIVIEEEDAKMFSPRRRAQTIAFIPQDLTAPFAFSVKEIVTMGRYALRGSVARFTEEDDEIVERAMQRMDVTHLKEKPITEISSGERMRAFLARALATEARIFLFDEPTAALDIRHTLEIFSLLRALPEEGKTALMSVHALSDALALGNRALILKKGALFCDKDAKDALTKETIETVFGVKSAPSEGIAFSLPD